MDEKAEKKIATKPHQIILEYQIGLRNGYDELTHLGSLLERLQKGEQNMRKSMTGHPEIKIRTTQTSLYLLLDDEKTNTKMTVPAIEEFLNAGAIPEKIKEIFPTALEEEVSIAFRRKGYDIRPCFIRQLFGYKVMPRERVNVVSIFSKRHVS